MEYFIYLGIMMTYDARSTREIKSNIFMATEALTFMHRVSCLLGQAFHYSPENAFYIFKQQIYFII